MTFIEQLRDVANSAFEDQRNWRQALRDAADELEALAAVNKWRGDKLEQYAQEIERLQSLLKARSDTLDLRWQDCERLEAEVERLKEIPCIVESPDGNPGWSTIGDAVKLLAAARRERDEVLAKTHDGTLWQPAYMLLMEERDRLRAERDECASTLAHATRLLNDVLESKTALRAALERIAAKVCACRAHSIAREELAK
jgi:DNA repair exonuclease SbcCD ATPase subunit